MKKKFKMEITKNSNGKCRLKKNNPCLTLKCGNTRMRLTFKSELFGIDSVQDVPVGKNEDCLPKFVDGEWIWEPDLGHCGMRIAEYNTEDDE